MTFDDLDDLFFLNFLKIKKLIKNINEYEIKPQRSSGHHSFNLTKKSLNFFNSIKVFWCVSFLISISCVFIFFFIN